MTRPRRLLNLNRNLNHNLTGPIKIKITIKISFASETVPLPEFTIYDSTGGRMDRSIRSSLRDLSDSCLNPALKRRAIFMQSLQDEIENRKFSDLQHGTKRSPTPLTPWWRVPTNRVTVCIMFITGLGTAAPQQRYTQGQCWEALQESARFHQLS